MDIEDCYVQDGFEKKRIGDLIDERIAADIKNGVIHIRCARCHEPCRPDAPCACCRKREV